MTEIEFREIKKIVILEEVRYNSEEEFYIAITGGTPPDQSIVVLWVEGVVFSYGAMPPNVEPFSTRYADEGVVYWTNVSYAKKEKYEEEKKIGLHTIKIIKPTAGAIIDVAKVLAQRLKEFK